MRSSSRSQVEGIVEAAKQKVDKLVKDMRPKVENGLEELQRTTSRTYQRLDSEYDLTDRTQRASRRMKEAAVDIDQTYGVRRRIRRAMEWFDRSKPVWGRKFEELTSTNTGKAIVVGATFLLMTTPIFWKVVNWIVLLWWLALPIATFMAVQKSQESAAQQTAEAEAERERRIDPLGSMFRDAASSARGATGTRSSKGPGRMRDEGPIIDAEWKPIDDKK
ncbi:hypothetical protein CEUSTIGMA_g6589.t1 [Chlamydomonas eustigma]|uniref:Uncharacterized protein n=1 Tax=Chlamydomonas eustigma TaxID=1157962 RepID=A0A250X897_9CHLO|nr:hypothetical protein CEUSTIGMA_g6589.t1 [Chlamydomonas eustigma]|eukprot:GAX79149.1 hypothetical protein CEUSTIGMA_g6589.t1 [Chlamydomonas eustigma]